MRRGALTLALLVALGGCGHAVIRADGPPNGNFTAVVSQGLSRLEHDKGSPMAILVERRMVRAVDPIAARELWSHPLRVTGHPVATEHTVVFPVRGHRLVAVDRSTGFVRWSVDLPGEALSGVTASEPYVVATVVGGRGNKRSRMIVLSTHDGGVRWTRRSAGRFGAPLALGSSVIVPLNRSVLAFDLRGGDELARMAVPRGPSDLDRIAVQRSAVVWAGGNQWVDLGAGEPVTQVLSDPYAPAFRSIRGFDPGHDDGERLQWWVRMSHDGSAPREAILMARRVVMAVRLDADARPVRAHWVHVDPQLREGVALHVGHDGVTVVHEDGSIVRLSMADGRVIDRLAGEAPVHGALLLDLADEPREAVRYDRLPMDVVHGQLARLLADPDPRILPAQRLAADLLWRDEDPETRELVVELARGRVRTEGSPAAGDIRSHAVDLVARAWGRGNERTLAGILAALAVEPSYLEDRGQPDLGALAHGAVRQGDPAVIPLLVRHLLHPATPAADLAEIARALHALDRPEATAGLAEFVVRYHADPDVVHESDAMRSAADALIARVQAGAGDASEALAARTLLELVDDPFTEAGLQAYIAARLPARAAAYRSHEPNRSTASEDDDVLVLSDSE